MCVFFKQGICLKGNKCKFSHKRKNAAPKKRDLHNDERDKARAGTCLVLCVRCVALPHTAAFLFARMVVHLVTAPLTVPVLVSSGHDGQVGPEQAGGSGREEREAREQEPPDGHCAWARARCRLRGAPPSALSHSATATEQVCKYFLDAIEREQYGWFWACPNGGKECKYRHALPPGFVFKTRRERELDKLLEMNKEDAATIETIIDEEVRAHHAVLPPLPACPLTVVVVCRRRWPHLCSAPSCQRRV